jgi:tRNA pseudouridine55 synthase
MKSTSADGLLVIDKPPGITSRDVVNRIQHVFPRRTRIGHTGTLDPLATGVLVVCIGLATRLSEYVQRMEKTYLTRLRLGAESDTDDVEGTIKTVAVSKPPSEETVIAALQSFVGEILQTPPSFSAAKVTGRRAYDLARAGREVSLAPRAVHIYALDLHAYDYPWLDIEVRCGKGTYIRSLARDLGRQLGCGALVETLRRTRVGAFDLSTACPLESTSAAISERLLPLHWAVAELTRIELQESDIAQIRQGRRIAWPASLMSHDLPAQVGELAAFGPDSALAAVVGIDRQQKLLFPLKVLPNSDLHGYT